MTDPKAIKVLYPEYKKVIRTTKLNSGEIFYSGYVLESRGSCNAIRHTVVEKSCTKVLVKDLVIKYIEGLKKDFLQEEHSSEEEFF